MWRKFKSFFPIQFSKETIFTKQIREFKHLTCTIRKAEHGDIRSMLAVERSVYDGDVPWTHSAFAFEMKNRLPHLYLVVEHEEKVIAFIGCRIKNKDAHITNLAVEREFQGKGIATFLLNEMKRFAKRSHASQMSLEVRFENKHAQMIYRKFGFESQKIMKNYYESQEDGLVMVYPLENLS
ncbi:ribosomal-protein-alanine N-acetyltransferase [Pilibacter termitis]|uniref:Ribosomal-protein-alanine N-acetyltransferase n=1 Tax=Pilibacter termitis TaxID=263852 RepID=A0A1T4KP94_9ENTE|nr:ribosomal protein S18-alanine N-acetyltransferase [Pilibacter termitis]SJZ44246.1 ribosomal-protein-alanine N-acetyltransferase [Pilibacter termitis]